MAYTNNAPRTVAFITLGCKVNTYESEAVAGLFQERGYSIVPEDAAADVYIVNTCSVTNMGARKSRQAIRRAAKRNPQALVVVMGCYSQYAPGEVAEIPGVRVVVGTHRRADIVDLVEANLEQTQPINEVINKVERIGAVNDYEELGVSHLSGRTRAILKVQDGCNENCAFCQIPRVRGRSRSRRLENVLAEVESLIDKRFIEIVLTGVHLGTYGIDLGLGLTLTDLVKQVAELPGLRRLRLSSIDPHEFTPELIAVLANHKNICRQLHIPAQSGEDGVLMAMRRRHTTDEFLDLAAALRTAMPGIAITTDVIVGFPGESDASFAATCQFCEAAAFSKVHVFPYSRRKGTVADKMPNQVAEPVRQTRVYELLALSNRLSLEYHRTLIGQKTEVLLEGVAEGNTEYMQGLTDTYVRTYVPKREGLVAGQLLQVVIAEATADRIKAFEEGRFPCPSK